VNDSAMTATVTIIMTRDVSQQYIQDMVKHKINFITKGQNIKEM